MTKCCYAQKAAGCKQDQAQRWTEEEATHNRLPKQIRREVTFRLIFACTPNARPKRVNSTGSFYNSCAALHIRCLAKQPHRLTRLQRSKPHDTIASTSSRTASGGLGMTTSLPRSAPFRNHSLLTLRIFLSNSLEKKHHQSCLIEILSG